MNKKLMSCVIENEQRNILLLHRNPDRRFFPDYWNFVSGHIELGESAKECLVRELNEELGVTDFEILIEAEPFMDDLSSDDEVYEMYVFKCRLNQAFVVSRDEHDDFLWIDPSELFDYKILKGLVLDLKVLGYEL
ncbi:MAG: NUDIX hydrolase [Nanoarchaeota archaeon]|nr:NUDIX hydrolase [Nanoarchaeota archaeon]MBU1854355.1 NUDIX hydrolase [Nanoarchaeota archaeon]